MGNSSINVNLSNQSPKTGLGRAPVTKGAITSVQLTSDKTGSAEEGGNSTNTNIPPNFGTSTFGATSTNNPLTASSVINSQIPLKAPITIPDIGFGAIGDGRGLVNNPEIPYNSIPNSPPSNLANLMAQMSMPPMLPNQEEDEEEKPNKNSSPPSTQTNPPSSQEANPDSKELAELKTKNEKLEEQVAVLTEKSQAKEKEPGILEQGAKILSQSINSFLGTTIF